MGRKQRFKKCIRCEHYERETYCGLCEATSPSLDIDPLPGFNQVFESLTGFMFQEGKNDRKKM